MNQPRYGAMFYFLGRFKFLYALTLGVTLVVSVLESLSVAAFLPLFSSLLGVGTKRQAIDFGSSKRPLSASLRDVEL